MGKDLYFLFFSIHHGRGGVVLSGLCEDVPARLSVSTVQHQRAAVVVQPDRRRCVCDRLRTAASLAPAPGSHHSAGPHTGRTPADRQSAKLLACSLQSKSTARLPNLMEGPQTCSALTYECHVCTYLYFTPCNLVESISNNWEIRKWNIYSYQGYRTEQSVSHQLIINSRFMLDVLIL